MQNSSKKTSVSILFVTILKAIGTALGVVVAVGVANLFGASAATDAFFLARRIILNISVAVERAFQMLQVPPMVELLRQQGLPAMKRVLNRQRVIVFGVSAVMTCLAFIYAQNLMAIFAPGFNADQTTAGVYYLRIMLLTLPITAVTGLTGAALNAIHVFSLPVAARLVPRLLIVMALFLVPLGFGLEVLSWAAVMGTLAMGTIFAIAIHRAFSIVNLSSPVLSEPSRSVFTRKRVVAMLIAQFHVLGASWIDMGFASLTGPGGVAILEFGQRLVNLAPGLVTSSVVMVYYTEFATALAAGETERFRSLMRQSLRTTLFMVLPLSVGLILFSREIVQILLEHGSFDTEASRRTQQIVAILGPILPLNALLGTLSAAIFADARLPHIRIVLVSAVLAVAVRVTIDLAYIETLGVIAVPIAAFAGMIVLVFVTYASLTLWIGAPIKLSESKPFIALALATFGSAATMWALRKGMIDGSEHRIWMAVDIALAAAAGLLVYLLLAAALHLPEVGIVRRRFVKLSERILKNRGPR